MLVPFVPDDSKTKRVKDGPEYADVVFENGIGGRPISVSDAMTVP
jgi:hypothetical protein